MDSRHESLKEGVLNHVIMTINTYMMDNIDNLVQDKILQDELTDICKRIYSYLGVNVDTENILSIHNLLSKDVVGFPNIADPEGNRILNDSDFEKLIFAIKNILDEKTATPNDDGLLKKQILRVIEEYEL